ncbi:MAG: toxin-antitoxin (TA) system antitoxin [Desulfamplus sp.]|nr:toxin-antitoxin (TA) system antitoxin [Desulfamplus sp.]
MLMKTINISETEANIKDLLSIVVEGTEIIITENKIPLARITPVIKSTPRKAGLHSGLIWTSEDFDEPLPESFWTDSYRECYFSEL